MPYDAESNVLITEGEQQLANIYREKFEVEQKYRAILDQAFEIIGLMTPEGTLVEANRAALKFAGIKESDVLGKPFWETPWWTHSSQMQDRLRDAIKAAASGEFVRFEATHPAPPDGAIHYIDFSLKPVKNERGEVVFLIPEGRDVTDRTRAEEGMREFENRFRDIIDNSKEGILFIDTDAMTIFSGNQAMATMLGRTLEELLGMPLFEIHPPDSHDRIAREFEEHRLGGRQLSSDIPVLRKDGSCIFVDITSTTVMLNGVRYLSGFFRDVTDRKKAGEMLQKAHDELEQSNRELKDYGAVIAAKTQALQEHAAGLEAAARAKDEFLANMSHELRTPLNAIIGFSEGLLERADRHPLNDHQKDRLAKINKSGQHLLGLINRILDTASVEAGITQVNPVSFDLETLVGEISGMADELMKSKPQVRYTIDLEKGLPLIVSDRDMLKQILINLISNAIKFTDQGRIKLWVRRDGQTILLSVEDTGIGIPEKHLDHVFDKFYQVPETMRGSLKGTGLGLSICKKYSSLLGGTLTARSIEGQGSTFTLCIPTIFNEEERKKQARLIEEVRVQCLALSAEENRPKVLCIEPEPTNVILLNDILIEARYQVIPAFDGAEGLFLATTMHPQVIILNVTLPGLDGWEVLHRIKANPPTCDIPIIIACTVEEKKLGLYFGASDFLVKPVDKARLLEALSRVSAHARMGKCTVAIVDDDVNILRITAEVLEKEGYRSRTYISGEEFLANLQEQRPDVVILDLLMPHLDGFQVLNAL